MIFVDIHEKGSGIPQNIQPYVETILDAYNVQGHSDYHWQCFDASYVEVERKQWSEISNIEAVEEQLFEHMRLMPSAHHVLLIEGIMVPDPGGAAVLKATKNPIIYARSFKLRRPSSAIQAWLYRVGRYVQVVHTADSYDSASTILGMYSSDQKEEHSTFSKNYARPTYHVLPQVSKLMGMYPGIGEAKATALEARFSTVYNVLHASTVELATVPGIGKVLARRILKEVGRPDVD